VGGRARARQNHLIDPTAKHFNANFIENLNTDTVFCLTFFNDLPLPNLNQSFNGVIQVGRRSGWAHPGRRAG